MKNVTKSSRLAELEVIIRETEPSAKRWLAAYRSIHEEKAYLEAGFASFKGYCEQRFPESFRTIKLALQVDNLRKELTEGQSSALDPDQSIQALAATASDAAIAKLTRAPKEKRAKILSTAAKFTNGKPTAKAVEQAIAKDSHKKAPKGGLANYSEPRKMNFDAYTSSPTNKAPTVPTPPIKPDAYTSSPTPELHPNPQQQLGIEIRGALKTTIDAHGSITLQNYGSASKRIESAIRTALNNGTISLEEAFPDL